MPSRNNNRPAFLLAPSEHPLAPAKCKVCRLVPRLRHPRMPVRLANLRYGPGQPLWLRATRARAENAPALDRFPLLRKLIIELLAKLEAVEPAHSDCFRPNQDLNAFPTISFSGTMANR